MAEHYIEIDGHRVDPDKADLFHNMDDGSRTTDEEWDESKRRMEEAEALEGDDAITWIPVADWNGDGGELGTNE